MTGILCGGTGAGKKMIRFMSTATAATTPSDYVLAHWRRFAGADVRPIHSGLINATFLLLSRSGERAVVQRLHPVFAAEVNLDIAAVTGRLEDRGLITPRILATDDDALWVETDAGIWRALSFVPGRAPQRLTDPAMAREAGRLVGRFHAALDGFDYRYRFHRFNVHDTAAHLKRLDTALKTHAGHRLYPEVAPLVETLLRDAETLVDLDSLPLRHAHGDLKISNLMFDAAGRGLCLIDLDTLSRMHWALEIGDALRSWCNPNKEDRLPARLDLALFEAAVAGYRESTPDLISEEEWATLVPGLARICLELSARFFADALNENYFGWEPERYPGRGEHNLARGRAMWSLYRDVMHKRGEAEKILGCM